MLIIILHNCCIFQQELLKEMEFDPAFAVLKREALKGKKGSIQYLPGQSVYIRIFDPQLVDFADLESKLLY